MDISTVKRKKSFVDRPMGELPLTCLITGLGNYSEQCKVLSDFVKIYASGRPSNIFLNKQEVNAMVDNLVDKLLQENLEKRQVLKLI